MLAINTAFMNANLALKTQKRESFRDIDSRSKHSENVLKTIDEMCQEANIDILDIETVGVVIGPGSFTGLRIGIAIAKALACVKKDMKFVSVSSLELMAYIVAKQGLSNGNFVCVLNALSDLYFVAYFDKNGVKLQKERMIDENAFKSIKEPIFALKDDLEETVFQYIEISSEDLLSFVKEKSQKEEFTEIVELEPMYLRLSQAEDNLLKKSKKD